MEIGEAYGKSKIKRQIGPIADEQGELVFIDLEKIGEKLVRSFQSGEVVMNPAFHSITPSVCDISLSEESFKVKFNARNPRKSHGADNMSSKEMTIVEFSPCIANLSRLSYSAGTYPSQWNIGKLNVLWKSGS